MYCATLCIMQLYVHVLCDHVYSAIHFTVKQCIYTEVTKSMDTKVT